MENQKTTPKELTDRELQEKQVELLAKQEEHQKYVSSVITIIIVIGFIALCAFILLSS